MHKCSETKERMIEMVLDGVDLGAEFDGCAECCTEFATLNATLRMTRRLSEATPDQRYWDRYHATLRQKIVTSEGISHAKAQRREEDAGKDRASALRLAFAPLRFCVRTAVRVPVLLLVLITLAFAGLGLVTARVARRPAVQIPVTVFVPVEVPVVREKVVTRVVYSDRRSLSKTSRRAVNDARANSTFANSRKPSGDEGLPGLTGFKPSEEIKLTLIKGGVPNEK